ncbi:hypothetical protein JB92DRAFT_2832700 [Gautieria morchelliformis]|nr:hypothetical protein JB92DRAFT_2832700 [Gautieria morchelliformis]
MDRRGSSKYRMPSAGRPSGSPGPPDDSPPSLGGWAQDRRTPRPLMHAQSPRPPPPPPPPIRYSSNQFIAMPEPVQPQIPHWSPPLPSRPTQIGYASYGYPTASTNGSQPNQFWKFPEPQITRSVSHKSSLHPPPTQFRPRAHSSTGTHPIVEASASNSTLRHKYSHSDSHGTAWYDAEAIDPFERSPSITPSILSEEFAQVSLSEPAADGQASADGLRRFQQGEGEDNDWAWHILVTKEARESLPPAEVMRQSAMFDLVNSERSYVNDLELVQEVFIRGLRQASLPVFPPDRLDIFVMEVFGNMDRILSYHQRMLDSLFDLQREQHPILLSVGDIFLDTVLKFQSEYDSYIKASHFCHYPLAESLHRRELKSNQRYRAFLENCSRDPRLGKRDLITFISRPVTRLPRLSLLLSEVKKRTEKLDEINGVSVQPSKQGAVYLNTFSWQVIVYEKTRFIKSTQPGIEASEGKVRFYALVESLRSRRDEIIDMDLYNENRTLIYSGPLARKQRSEHWGGWTDLEVGLLDNYGGYLYVISSLVVDDCPVLITKPDTTGRNDVVSRPIPLEYLRLGPFNGPAENRREERSEGGGLFDSIIKPTRPMFPLVICHASSPARRYTLYAKSENERKKWHAMFRDALGLRKVVMDANQWFAVNSINDGFFRMRTALVPGASAGPFTGRITAAVAFTSGGKNFVAAATPSGIFAAVRGQSKFSQVLPLPSVTHMAALQGFNRLIILHHGVLTAYSLDMVARVGQGQASQQALDTSSERPAKADHNGNVMFFRVGSVAGRVLVVYACKHFLSFTLNVLEAVGDQPTNTVQKSQANPRSTFRAYGEEPLDVTLLAKTVAVSTDRFMTVVDPTNLSGQPPVPIPDFSPKNNSCDDSPMAALKAKSENARPIGIIRSGKEELLVIYDEFGCYVTKRAVPTRKCGYVRWETKAVAYATRGLHMLLFSPQFLEIRHVPTGRLVQVMEGRDFRLMQSLPGSPLLVVRRGKDDKQGMSDELVELVETAPFETSRTPGIQGTADTLWDEWD